MSNNLKNFITNFLQNKGHFVFLSLLIAKITGFLSSIVVIRLLPESEFGILSIVLSILTFFIPFSGLGSAQILLRFGSILPPQDKSKLSSYLFAKGLLLEIILVLIFLICSIFYINQYSSILIIFLFLAVRLFGFYFLSHIQTYYRITGQNQIFARLSNVCNIFGFIILFSCTYFWQFYGYLFAIAIMPYLSLIGLKKEMFSYKKYQPFNLKELWSFGFFTALTAVFSEALFSIDILLLSFFLDANAVANYKVAILLPSNITFLVLSFMQSDYPRLAKNYQNKAFLKTYLINFYKLFIPITILILLLFYCFRSQLIQLFFGQQYLGNETLMLVLVFGFAFGMLTRNLYGNLLPAIGKVKINSFVSVASLIIISIISYFLVHKIGLMGMGISMLIVLVFEGITYLLFFRRYLHNLS